MPLMLCKFAASCVGYIADAGVQLMAYCCSLNCCCWRCCFHAVAASPSVFSLHSSALVFCHRDVLGLDWLIQWALSQHNSGVTRTVNDGCRVASVLELTPLQDPTVTWTSLLLFMQLLCNFLSFFSCSSTLTEPAELN